MGILVGGLEFDFYDFPIILGISSSQLTNISIIFQRGRSTTNQGYFMGLMGSQVGYHGNSTRDILGYELI